MSSFLRCTNHEELMETLKEVNQTIQKAGRLRIGRSKVRDWVRVRIQISKSFGRIRFQRRDCCSAKTVLCDNF